MLRRASSDVDNFGKALFASYTYSGVEFSTEFHRMVFGSFDALLDSYDGVLHIEDVVFLRILYMAFSFTVVLMLLNLLIAIMGDSFGKIKENNEVSDDITFGK